MISLTNNILKAGTFSIHTYLLRWTKQQMMSTVRETAAIIAIGAEIRNTNTTGSVKPRAVVSHHYSL